MIVNLICEFATSEMSACHAEAPGVPAHRVAAFPFEEAEREVRRRCLRSLADRANPPTAVVFVRTWEHVSEPGGHCVPTRMGAAVHVGHPAQQLAIDAFRAEQAIAVTAFPEDAGVTIEMANGDVTIVGRDAVPQGTVVAVDAEQVTNPPRRGRKAKA